VANPSKYGLTNVTGAACDPVKIAAITANRVTDGSSLFCNAAPATAFPTPLPNLNGLKTGASASTWLFADGVHPTTGGHRVLADQVFDAIKGFGWVPNNL
jgi:outer membrane lipase/esterase